MSSEPRAVGNPKSEGRRSKEGRNPKFETRTQLSLFPVTSLLSGFARKQWLYHWVLFTSDIRSSISDFGLLSDFGLGSDFPPPGGVTFVLPLCPNIDNTKRLNFTGF